MRKSSLPPNAPSMIESTRSIGYTLETAIADLIDNSITACATEVWIDFSPYDEPYIAILDNGHGMSPTRITEAMRHGSTNPNQQRNKDDLGRYGLGLKTASMSQCRRLIVVSWNEGVLSGRCWDLDVIIEDNDWTLLEFDTEDFKDLPLVDRLCTQKSGTLVIWQNLDRIAEGELSLERALGEQMDIVRKHLELVFHRYLTGEPGLTKITIRINEEVLQPRDPFLSTNKSTTPLPEQVVTVANEDVSIKPFILPHLSKLSATDLEKVGGYEDMRSQQGFYVYRNRRLITWGTWFRLVRLEELSKLARVRVDIPNSLDHLWTLDIKKSTAYPPELVRRALAQIIDRIVGSSKRVYTYRGQRRQGDNFVRAWDRIQGREGVCYRINREHPLVISLMQGVETEHSKGIESLLAVLETTLPIDALYADMASDKRIDIASGEVKGDLKQLAHDLLSVVAEIDGGRDQLLSGLSKTEPFCLYPEVTEQLLHELSTVILDSNRT